MIPSNILRQLKSEALNHPKRAAILGLLVLVGIYFWVPLLVGWVGAGDGAATVATAAPVPSENKVAEAGVPMATRLPAGAPDGVDHAGRPWAELLERMDRDRRMESAELTNQVRDPFRSSGIRGVDGRMAPNDEAEDELVDVSPGEAGLILTSTLVGGNDPVAVINGNVYRARARIRAGDYVQAGWRDEPTGNVEFLLAEVGPDYVVLTRNKNEYRLKLQGRQKKPENIVITVSQ